MTIGYGDLRKGMAIELDGEPYSVVDYERSKMQKRAPVMRVRFQGFDVKLTPAPVERRDAQYIYEEDGMHYFMDMGSFDQFPLSGEQVGDRLDYMVEQTSVEMVFFGGQPIAIELPITVDLTVAETEPGFKGDTAQGGTKPAKLSTGLTVQVPLFVNAGETIRVDTRSGEYLSRV